MSQVYKGQATIYHWIFNLDGKLILQLFDYVQNDTISFIDAVN